MALGPIGQIGLGVADVDRAEAFYGDVLGLRKLFRFGDLSFFDCAGVRLLLDKSGPEGVAGGSPIYFGWPTSPCRGGSWRRGASSSSTSST